LIGIDVTAGREDMVGGVVQGERRPCYLHEVEIQIGGWWKSALVGFMPELSNNGHGLLGRAGFFDRFTFVKFEQPKSTIEVGTHVT
jgi:hypothetical protein